jgi:hypothetical protein
VAAWHLPSMILTANSTVLLSLFLMQEIICLVLQLQLQWSVVPWVVPASGGVHIHLVQEHMLYLTLRFFYGLQLERCCSDSLITYTGTTQDVTRLTCMWQNVHHSPTGADGQSLRKSQSACAWFLILFHKIQKSFTYRLFNLIIHL